MKTNVKNRISVWKILGKIILTFSIVPMFFVSLGKFILAWLINLHVYHQDLDVMSKCEAETNYHNRMQKTKHDFLNFWIDYFKKLFA